MSLDYELANICNGKIDILDISNFNDIEGVVKTIESKILKSALSKVESRFLMSKVFQWKRKKLINKISQTTLFTHRLKDILSDTSYIEKDEYIVRNGHIPITAVSLDGTDFVYLNEHKSSLLSSKGFGIDSFWVEKTFSIRDVWCNGKHPNLNFKTQLFCLDPSIYDSSLDIVNLMILESALSFANLNHYFKDDPSMVEFLKIIEEKE